MRHAADSCDPSPMKTWQNGILGGVVGAAAVVALIWLASLPQTLVWIEAHDGLAAWLQAIFSVGAIAAAWATLVIQERRQHRAQMEQARQLALKDHVDRLRLRTDQLESLTVMSDRLLQRGREVECQPDYFHLYLEDDLRMMADSFGKVDVSLLRDPVVTAAMMNLRRSAAMLLRHLNACEVARAVGTPPSGLPLTKMVSLAIEDAVKGEEILSQRLEEASKKLLKAEAELRSPLAVNGADNH